MCKKCLINWRYSVPPVPEVTLFPKVNNSCTTEEALPLLLLGQCAHVDLVLQMLFNVSKDR